MTRRKEALTLGLISLLAALAPAPMQTPDAPGDWKAVARAKVVVCRRMVEYYRETVKAPPKPNDIQDPADRYAASYEPIELWSRRLADAQLDAAGDGAGRVAILQGEVDRIEKFSGELRELAKDSPEWKLVSDRVEYYRLDALLRLQKEKAGK